MLIAGPTSATYETVRANVAQFRPHPRFIDEMMPALWAEARAHGLDPVVMVGQAGNETGWGRFGGVIDATYRNTCGLKTRAGGDDKDPNAHARFPTWELGARAHAQHLLAYLQVWLPGPLVDPRYEWVYGKRPAITTVEQLTGSWATQPDYGNLVLRNAEALRKGATVSYDDGWIPGWQHAPSQVREGMWYAPGYPPRITWHTTEGSTFGTSYITTHQYTPQIWVSWKRRLVVQVLPLIYAGYATYGGGNPYDTRTVNGHVQIELEGRAADSAGIPQDALDWLAEAVTVPIMRFYARQGWKFNVLNTPDVANEVMGGSAAENAPQRMSVNRWALHDGMNGHRHVVWNGDRWDPGPMDLLYVARKAHAIFTGQPAGPPVQPPTSRRRRAMITPYYRMSVEDPTQRATVAVGQDQGGVAHIMDFPPLLPGGLIFHHPKEEGGNGLVKFLYKGHLVAENWSGWNLVGTFTVPDGLPDRNGNKGGAGFATLLVPADVEYNAVYYAPTV
jgi:hypothetical protein